MARLLHLGRSAFFLDHHLKPGNSLVGATIAEAKKAIEGATQLDLFGSRFAGLMSATELMRRISELSDVTAKQVEDSRREYRKASDSLAPFKRMLNVYTSQWFGNEKALDIFGRGHETSGSRNLARLSRYPLRTVQSSTPRQRVPPRSPFSTGNWSFPRFSSVRVLEANATIERLDGAGFDAVIGNPPV